MTTPSDPKPEQASVKVTRRRHRHIVARKSNAVVISVISVVAAALVLLVTALALSKRPSGNSPRIGDQTKKNESQSSKARDERGAGKPENFLDLASDAEREGHLAEAIRWYKKAQEQKAQSRIANKIKELEAAADAEGDYQAVRKEIAQATDERALAAIEHFLEKHPDSSHASWAQAQAQRLRDSIANHKHPADVPPKKVEGKGVDAISDSDRLSEMFKEFAQNPSGDARLALARRLESAMVTAGEKRDLVAGAGLLLSRPEYEWGLVVDRVETNAQGKRTSYEGKLGLRTESRVELRLCDGTTLTAEKVQGSTWRVTMPGSSPQPSEVTLNVRLGAPIESKNVLEEHFKRFPPQSWPSARAQDHISEAKLLVDALGRLTPERERIGLAFLRVFAASHALAAQLGDETSSKAVLKDIGFVDVGQGQWEFASDTTLLALARLLRQKKNEDEAIASALKARYDKDSRARYAALVLRILHPVSRAEDVNELIRVSEDVRLAMRSRAETQHVDALMATLKRSRPCSRCSGQGVIRCARCNGAGTLEMKCGTCHGNGIIQEVGPGGGTKPCPSCGGTRPIWTEPCPVCESNPGKADCPQCEGPYRLPTPGELIQTSQCAVCSGRGEFGLRATLACPRCRGLGYLVIPAGDPGTLLPW